MAAALRRACAKWLPGAAAAGVSCCGLAAAGAARYVHCDAATSESEEQRQQRLLKDPGLQRELAKLRPTEATMRARWIRDEDGWRKLPPRAWPTVQPKADEIPGLRRQLEEERCPAAGSSQMSERCSRLTFDLATALVFNNVDPKAGFTTYEALAAAGDCDAMVGAAVVMIEGLGIPDNAKEGLRWLTKACELDSAQGQYELATLKYMGAVGVPCDEPGAFVLYEKAAAKQHASGMFLVADCLLEGIGCQEDPARAVSLLMAAAEKGHRGARQYIRQLLDGVWPGSN
eukprot:TRINITY_DN19028_c0_g1_i1.p1 TRINITY_DN19028_c0_g1~~TRINITY_DN19028_c0_g1_i1.p1  ORF type:complete len:287 (+),score=80.82 TRINITY_DN19028_c0_g1_i1:267-1127(+)